MRRLLPLALLALLPLAADGPAPARPASPGMFNAVAFGARGDNAADDTAALQASLDAAARTGGRVVVPCGVYRLSRTLRVSNPAMIRPLIVQGDGVNTCLVIDDPAAAPDGAIHLSNSTWCVLRDVYIKGPQDAPVGVHVDVPEGGSTENVLLENVFVEGFDVGFGIGFRTAGDVSEVDLFKCVSSGAKSCGYKVGNGTGANVLNVRFYGCSARSSGGYGVLGDGSCYAWNGGTAQNNQVADFGYAQQNGAPVVVSGVRSEGSRRFWYSQNTEASPSSVLLQGVLAAGLTDPAGDYVHHGSGSPLTLVNCSFDGAAPARFTLGFDVNHPLPLTMIGCVVNSDAPLGHTGPHLQPTIVDCWRSNGGAPIAPLNLSNVRRDAMLVVPPGPSMAFPLGYYSTFRVRLTQDVPAPRLGPGYDGQSITIQWAQDVKGKRSYAWPSNVRFAGKAPAPSKKPWLVDSVSFVCAEGIWLETSRAIGVGK